MASEYWKNWYSKNKEYFLKLVNEHKRKRRRKFQEIINQHKDVPCIICNVKFPPEAMDFYHRDKDQKFFRISAATRLIYSIKKLLEELNKCDIYCANCRKIIETEEFLKNNKPGTTGSSIRRKKLRDFVNSLKGKPCLDCKKVFPVYCMEFDHLGEKEGTIAKMVSECRPMDKIKNEIDKSEPVCINCHRIRTRKRKK